MCVQELYHSNNSASQRTRDFCTPVGIQEKWSKTHQSGWSCDHRSRFSSTEIKCTRGGYMGFFLSFTVRRGRWNAKDCTSKMGLALLALWVTFVQRHRKVSLGILRACLVSLLQKGRRLPSTDAETSHRNELAAAWKFIKLTTQGNESLLAGQMETYSDLLETYKIVASMLGPGPGLSHAWLWEETCKKHSKLQTRLQFFAYRVLNIRNRRA